MLELDLVTGKLRDAQSGLVFADRPYRYSLTALRMDGVRVVDSTLTARKLDAGEDSMTLTGRFKKLGVELSRAVRPSAGGVAETLVIKNVSPAPLSIQNIDLGFCADLAARPGWRLCAIPFKVQLDGSRHDYPVQALIGGAFNNSVFEDPSRKYMPPLTEEGCLRSEAWAWGTGQQGLVVIKYNNQEIELSTACPLRRGQETWLRFGGAGFCLYGEPAGARLLEPGEAFTFGTTYYFPYQGGPDQAFTLYRDFLEARGHTFPDDYNPPVNWNELYDVGWYHSNPEKLKRFYTLDALLGEAAKAQEIGCELLYLDPGWEVCEGTTLWDETRLGSVKALVERLEKDYGLGLGYRTVLRTYRDHWPAEYLVQHSDQPTRPAELGDLHFWEVCLCNPAFWDEKLRRILEISQTGVRFMMVDEFDWRGPCSNPAHNHPRPTAPLDHAMAVVRLCRAIREACPGLTIEAHDPIWPWNNSLYVPTYFQQGFSNQGSYDENWGFEYMWDCLNDLKSGRALALYYYNLACSIPLYLHITMAADNDACVFFWWVASTVRHLGIGGKASSPTIEPPGGLPAHDPERRFAAYKEQMKLYRALKPFFARGAFHGIAENAHLHTLPGKKGGVLNLFNLGDEPRELEFFLPAALLQTGAELPVTGADAAWDGDGVTIRLRLPGMTPAVVRIGEALQD